jgi:hypothetical protein
MDAGLEAYMSAVLAAGSGGWDLTMDDGVLSDVEIGPGTASKEPSLSVVYSSAAAQSSTDAHRQACSPRAAAQISPGI